MAKTPTTPAKTNHNQPLIPKATDPRAEMFYLLGRIAGQNIEGANRLCELVVELTAQAEVDGRLTGESK